MTRRPRLLRSAGMAAAASALLITGLVSAPAASAVDDCGYTAPFFIPSGADLTGCTIDAGGTTVLTLGPVTVSDTTILNASSVSLGGALGSSLTLQDVTGTISQVGAVEVTLLTLVNTTGAVTLTNASNRLAQVDLSNVGGGTQSIRIVDSAGGLLLSPAAVVDGRALDVTTAGGFLDVNIASGSRLGTGSRFVTVNGVLRLAGVSVDGGTLEGSFGSANIAGADLANLDVSDATVCGVFGTPVSLPTGYVVAANGCLEPAPEPVYVVSALGAPIDGGGVLNVAKAGSTVPFKFSVTKDGAPLTTLTSATASATWLSCDASGASDPIESYTTAPGGTLVNNGDGSYQYNYKTAKSWTGCKTLTLDLGEGITVSAAFRFR